MTKLTIIIALLVTAILIAFIVWVMPREEKRDYPSFEPTELPTVAPWTPDPEEVGK